MALGSNQYNILDHELAQALRDESFGWQRLRPLLVDIALFGLMAALFQDRAALPLWVGLYLGHALTDQQLREYLGAAREGGE